MDGGVGGVDTCFSTRSLSPSLPPSLPPSPPLQLVDRMDQGSFNVASGTMTYQSLYKMVSKALYRTHVEGKLKSEIIQV